MLGDQIRRAREARGWTQADLASRLNVGIKTVSNWEGNHVQPRNRLGMLREVLGANFDAVDAPNALDGLSDLALLSELTRRAIQREHGVRAVD